MRTYRSLLIEVNLFYMDTYKDDGGQTEIMSRRERMDNLPPRPLGRGIHQEYLGETYNEKFNKIIGGTKQALTYFFGDGKDYPKAGKIENGNRLGAFAVFLEDEADSDVTSLDGYAMNLNQNMMLSVMQSVIIASLKSTDVVGTRLLLEDATSRALKRMGLDDQVGMKHISINNDPESIAEALEELRKELGGKKKGFFGRLFR